MDRDRIETIRHAARLSVAPMMDWTDRHCRAFHRVLSGQALLYTEMVTAPALVRGGAHHLLEFGEAEHPVALQLGGSDLEELAEAARIGAERGYDEINLNCGCPSDRVQSGTFGAVLMTEPARVAECVAAMRAAVDVEVTVKCRIGVDEQDPETVLPDFIARVRDAGVRRISIHARKAWLQGLSPKENRDVPPLDYPLVARMKDAFPDLHLSVNGGVADLDAAELFFAHGLDGVMIGRAAYQRPWDILGQADERIFGAEASPCAAPEDAARAMRPYLAQHLEADGKLGQVTRHMLGLFAGRPGARAWRRVLSDGSTARGEAGLSVYDTALDAALGERAAA
ncbi:tRNA dihydrouridine(20/20a) synthase DusA [Roseivivax marinus]|uniref:tRNA dihydrouridine(20/20a) synthase DusA n=1 Tax=Roseivivax marinus TaxID=1379903 RepID=UPI00273DE686|nr:tRNA dihydrouridine(20/20a) synthase DusA [Roseivivax marinus]